MTPSLQRPLAFLLLCIGLAATPTTSRATVTLEVYFENGTLPAGALAVLAADVDDDGFQPLTDPSVSGSTLAVGESIGESDDVIVSVFHSSSGPDWFSGAGIASAIPSIDYASFGIDEGTPLIIYVFPDLSEAGSVFILGDEFVIYRNSEIGGSGGDAPFLAPANPGVYTLSALTASNGGNFDPANLAAAESYLEGNTGSTGSGSADDHGNSRMNPTQLTEDGSSGALSPGDLDFFQFELSETSSLNASVSGDVLANGWIFDEDGNIIYAPPGSGSGPFSLSQVLEPGLYFLVLQGIDDNESGNYTLNFASTPYSLPLSLTGLADISIGRSLGKQKGNNLYSADGAGQQLKLKTKAGKKIKAYLTVGSDRGDDAQIALKGKRSDRFYKLKYISLSGSGNVTAAVRRGGYFNNYSANLPKSFRVELKPTREGKQRRKGAKFKFDAVGADTLDRAKLKSKVSKK